MIPDLCVVMITYRSMQRPPVQKYDPDTPLLVTGILRIATKYQVEPLRTRIVEHVKADWPQTLVEWDRLETDIAQLAQAHAAVKTALGRSRYRIDGRYLDQRVAEPVAAIRLAREFNIPSILPAAFYTLARISPEHDRHPHPETLGPTIWSQWDTQPAFRTARWSLLTTEDYRCLVRGQSMILDQHFRINGCYVNDDCESRTECDEAWGDQMLNGFEILNHVTNHDVLQAWAEFYSPQRLRDSGLCWSCRDHHAKRANLAREEVWDGLPSWFGLAED